jgi:hypothetical protein
MNAPACWDKAISIIFSSETMIEVKKEMGPQKSQKLPENFYSFFAHYQDNSWIISSNVKDHLTH